MAEVKFFFTNFPHEYMEGDMWKIYQRWGRVIDVFISRRLDSGRRRFGFVRFQGVLDAHILERKLDIIWIGLWKLWVNIPKFSRKKPHRLELGDVRKHELARKAWRQRLNKDPLLRWLGTITSLLLRRSWTPA